jgi:hypothetical protein
LGFGLLQSVPALNTKPSLNVARISIMAEMDFLPSAGLSDAQATYLAAVLVLCYCAVMIWVNRKDLG